MQRGRDYQGGKGGGGGVARTAVLICLALSVLATAGGVGVWNYARGLNDDLDRNPSFEGLEDRPDETGSLNLLVLGTDSRDPEGGDPSRADTIMLAHVPPDEEAAYIISLPRDLWVDIPAGGDWGGGEAKLNAAQFHGGHPLMVQTVEDYTGVLLDHVIEIDFDGLEQVVDALGGVDMEIVPADVAEYCLDTCDVWRSIHKNSEGGYNTFEAGIEEDMNGERALDYVRQRYQFATSDFVRMQNQQQLLLAMMDKATSSGIISSPNRLRAFLKSITDTLLVDEDFNLIETGLEMSHLRSDDLDFLTSPVVGTDKRDGQSVVIEDPESAQGLYQAIRENELGAWLKANPEVTGEEEDEE